MKTTCAVLAILAAALAGPVRADDDCYVPMADWQPRGAVAKLAEDNKWTVRRIKIDDGCYEVRGQDADGRRIEVKINPQTLEIVEFELKRDDD